MLLSLVTAKRVHDLTVLRFSPAHLTQLGVDSIVLQPAAGCETDRQGHLAPSFKLTAYQDERLCPVKCLSEYLTCTAPLRRMNQQLFISPFIELPCSNELPYEICSRSVYCVLRTSYTCYLALFKWKVEIFMAHTLKTERLR